VEKMTTAMKQHNKLVSERDDLKNELERKQRLAIQAIAARGNMKQHLDEAKDANEKAMQRIAELQQEIVEAGKEVQRYKQKHDEMFASVSGLNSRIEELEQHKLHLLDKLKSYGDRGDLGYIVKTQKLEDIKAKEMKDRVVLEDYKPEANRG
jgi:chromosome segregation ATPase